MLTLYLHPNTVLRGKRTADLFPAFAEWVATRGLTKPHGRAVDLHDLEVLLSPKTPRTAFQQTIERLGMHAERTPHRTVGGRLLTLQEVHAQPKRPRGRPPKSA